MTHSRLDVEAETPDEDVPIRRHDWHVLEFDLVGLIHNTTAFED